MRYSVRDDRLDDVPVITTIFWESTNSIRVENDYFAWQYPIEYPDGRSKFAVSDGSIIEATRNGGKPRVYVLDPGSSRYQEFFGGVEVEGEVEWIARAWDLCVLTPPPF